MFLNTSFTILLSLVAPKNVVGGASADTAERLLQTSVQCLANNRTFASCCPTQGVDLNNRMCTLLLCLNGLLIRDGCSCHNIEEACNQLAVFVTTGFPSLPGMCDMVSECCINNGTTTTNVDWDFCKAEAQEEGNFTLPDLWIFDDDVVMTINVPTTSWALTAMTVTTPTSNPTTGTNNLPTTLAPTTMTVTAPTPNPTTTTTNLPTTPAQTDMPVTAAKSNLTTAIATMSPTTIILTSITATLSPTTDPTSSTTTANATRVISTSTPTTAPTSNVTADVILTEYDGRGMHSSAIVWVLIGVITTAIIAGLWYYKNRRAKSTDPIHESHAVDNIDSVI